MTNSTPTPTSPSIDAPPKPNPVVLEERWLHKVMVFIQSFHYRPLWQNWLFLLAMFAAVYGLWWLVAPAVAFSAVMIFAGGVLFDLVLLWQLPKRGVSFGPIAPQLIIMLLPRLAAMFISLVVALWLPDTALTVMIILQGLGILIYVWAMLYEPHLLRVTTLHVESPHLPADAPPIRILHISDLHVENLTSREVRVVQFAELIQPDLIVITGDYLNLSYNDDADSIVQVRGLLSKIDAPLGVYATLGSPPVDLPHIAAEHFTDSHIKLLRHDAAEIDLGEGRTLTLLGMDCSHDMAYDTHQFDQLFAKKNGRPGATVLLYHSPELMPDVQKYDVDLYLCGHTHGGQVRIPGYGAILTSAVTGKRYEMGRYDENGTTLYVSRGIGLEGLSAPRIRLFCRPEMTLITLSGTNNDA